ncbi:hypothetical protein D3C71_1619060 [compost metagenome]
MEPALADQQARNVAAPDLIDRDRLKIALKPIRRNEHLDASGSKGMRATLLADQVCFHHQLARQMPTHRDLLGFQVFRHHPRSETFSAFSVQLHHLCLQRFTLAVWH